MRQAQLGASYRVPCPVSRQEVPIGQSLTSSPYRVLRGRRSRSCDQRTKTVKRTLGTLQAAGETYLPQAIQPRKSNRAVGDGFKRAGSQNIRIVLVRSWGATEVQERGMQREKHQEPGVCAYLGGPFSSSGLEIGGRPNQPQEERPMGRRDSDHLIVLRDGRTDHMGKGMTVLWSPHKETYADTTG